MASRRGAGGFSGAVRRLAGGVLATALLWSAVAPAAAADPVRINGAVYLGDLPTLVAREESLFRAQGLAAEVRLGASGRDNLRALHAGDVDFALMALTPLVLDRLADAAPAADDAPVILGGLVHSPELNRVVVREGASIRSAADLAGARVGVARGTNAEYLWWLFAAYHGFPPGAAEVVDTPVAALPGHFASGAVDAAVLWEPWVTRLEQRLDGALRTLPGSSIYTAKWVLVTTRGRVRARPREVRSVLAAYREAIETIDRRPQHALDLYAREAGLPRDALLRQRLPLFSLTLDWSLLTALHTQVEWARSAGRAVPGERPDVLAWLAPAPLRRLMPHAVGIPSRPDESAR